MTPSRKTYIVTGGAGALGSAIVRRLHGEGAHVAAIDSARSLPRLDALRSELGTRLDAHAFDLADDAAWSKAREAIEESLGQIDGAVLCAGAWTGGPPFADGGAANVAPMMRTNFLTAERSLAALLPAMVGRRRGSIVVIGSRNVERPWSGANAAGYTASKAALVALAQAIAAENVEHGVRLNAVLPSTLDTPKNRSAMPDSDPSRWVAVDSVADVVSFLLSDAARDVSGAAIPVYGRS